ncbi:MAG TPA: hypothetical protein VHD90_17370 [Phototrophicaceae bacterium]|nr:hypothetical protein [Phototrophicaceae bacterium]
MIRRAAQAITFVLIGMFAVAGYLGLRALVWRSTYQIAAMIQSGLEVSLLVGAALTIGYLVLGSALGRLLNIDWISLQLGALVGALMYGGYNAITPLSPLSVGETPLWRALQGGTDGLALGLVIGALVWIVSGRALRLDRAGLTRYLILYVTVILLAWLILLVESSVHVPDVVGVIIAFPLMAVLRLAVAWLDRRVDRRIYG